jgi:hypothetical protein
LIQRRDRKRRNQRITAGVVGIAVFVAAVWIVTSGGWFDRTETPAVPGPAETGPPPTSERVGFIGLPPEGAAPSAPERGELVLEFHGGTPSTDMYTDMWMYADGRLIWRQDTDVPYGTIPGGANLRGAGLLERGLTQEGLDLVLSEVISTGLFEKNLELPIEGWFPDDNCGFDPGIEVRIGDRLIRLTWVARCGEPELQLATPEQADAVVRLIGRLTDPASWLPEHAWEDREIRAYVPSRYAICANRVIPSVGVEGLLWPRLVTTSEIVDQLPGPVKALIYADGRAIPEIAYGGCYEVTTDEARAIVRALDDAGLEPKLLTSLTYVFDTPELRWERGFVSFRTILPHGEMAES